MFKGIKDTWKKSEAAVIVQNLLQMQYDAGRFGDDPASSANTLIASLWDKTPHRFDGRFGQRPHKLSVAAAAFANAIRVLGHRNENSMIFSICLGNILNEVNANGSLYPLSRLDDEILTESAIVLQAVADEFSQDPLFDKIASMLDESST